MVKKPREKEYHFSLQTIVRTFIFLAIAYLLITLISARKLHLNEKYDPTVLGEEISSSSAQLFLKNTTDSIYNKLPQKSQETIKNMDKNPIIIIIQEKFDYIKNESVNFPQKQIKEIKKAIINNIYQDMIKSIDSDK